MNIGIDQDYLAEKRLKAAALSCQAKMVFNQLTAKAKYGNARENTLALAEIDRLEAENVYYQGELIRVEKAIKRKEEHVAQLKEKLEVLKANPAPIPPSHLRKIPRAYVAAAAAQIVPVTRDPNCPEPETPGPLLTEAVPEGTELPENVPAGSVPGEPQPEPLVVGKPLAVGDKQMEEKAPVASTAVVFITPPPEQLQQNQKQQQRTSLLAEPQSQLGSSPSTPSQMAVDQGHAVPMSEPAESQGAAPPLTQPQAGIIFITSTEVPLYTQPKEGFAAPPPPPPLPTEKMLRNVRPQRLDSSTDATSPPQDSLSSTRTLVNAPGVSAKQGQNVNSYTDNQLGTESAESEDSFKIPVVRV